ncbi:putative membrane protein [Acinetobacter baumannii 1437282]|nr:putative membrane protein [Acinetobacter baumannii 1437282]
MLAAYAATDNPADVYETLDAVAAIVFVAASTALAACSCISCLQ